MTLLLDRATIEGLLSMKEAIDLTEQAFQELADQTVDMPQRLVMADAERAGNKLFMPAHMKGIGALGVKVVTVFHNNPTQHGLPTILANITLLDQETGKTLCIMEGGYITAMRTGAVSGVATKYMARPDASVAGVVGTGAQARTQLSAMCAVRPIERAVCVSTGNLERQRAFIDDMSQEMGIQVDVAASVREVVERSDVIALATTSPTPIVEADWFKPGTHINAVGAHSPAARELDAATVVRSRVVCDLTSACMAEAGDLIIPIQEGAYSQDSIYGELGELVSGRKSGRDNDQEITLFKSVGLSVQDIATAHFVYEKALAQGAGTTFDF